MDASSPYPNSRPIAAPVCATSLAAGPSRSSRAISEACKVAGTDNAGCGTADSAAARLRAGFEHRLGQFLDEQRHAVGALGDLLHDLGWQRRIPGDVRDHRRRVAPVEPWQRQHRHMRLPGPWRLKLGAEHRQQQHRPVRDPLYHAVQQFARTRIDPVKVIEHHQHRLLPRKTFNLPQQRLERLLLLALRRDIERRREIG